MKLIANHVLLNHAAASQSNIGWHNFLKGSISDEWATLWTKSMGAQTAKACKHALIQSLWDHTYRLWTFINSEDHKNYNLDVAQYKQQALDIKIAQQYHTFQHNDLPLNALQQNHFNILQEELFLNPPTFTLAMLQTIAISITVHMLNTSFTTPPDVPQTHKPGSNFFHTISLLQL
jgi:hypothetical protein